MVAAVHANFPSSNATAGNKQQVRTWLGDVQSIPAYQVRSALLPDPLALMPYCTSMSCAGTIALMDVQIAITSY